MTSIDASAYPDAGQQKLAAAAALSGRVLIGPIFLLSGVGKITSAETYLGYIGSVGIPFPAVALVSAIFLELAGGVALIVGYKTRIVGATLAAFCIATAAIFHSDLGDQNQFLHFWKNLAMAGGLLQLAAFGAGRFGLDARLA